MEHAGTKISFKGFELHLYVLIFLYARGIKKVEDFLKNLLTPAYWRKSKKTSKNVLWNKSHERQV